MKGGRKVKRKILLSLILSFICLISFQRIVYADTGSITITYEIENDDGNGNRTSVPVHGAPFKYFKVWCYKFLCYRH